MTVLTTDYGTRIDDRAVSLSVTVDGTPDFVNTFVYDADDRLVALSQIGQGGNAVADKLVTFTYDDNGQFLSVTRYAVLDGTQLVATSESTYDPLGRIVGLVHYQDAADPLAEYTWSWTGGGDSVEIALTGTPSGPQFGSGWMFFPGGTFAQPLSREIEINPLPDYVWSFDTAFTGHLTQMTSPDGTADYTYDPRGQLLAADYDYQPGETYSYDANGNRTNPGYATGDHNRLLSDGTYSYEYDAEGNRTRRIEIATGEITEYQWDHRNRLIRISTRTTDNGPLTTDIQYVYDTQNRWIAKRLDSDGDGPQDPLDVHFVYDGNQIILQLDDTGALTNRYLWGPAVDQLLADEQVTDPTAAGNVLWPLTDHLGTVRDLAVHDPETGTTIIVNHITYDAFGRILTQTDPAVSTLFAFTARLFDAATGLQNNLNRWYDPEVGRWLSEDPIAFAAGDANLYRYVENMPTIYGDPNGLDPPGWHGLDPSGVGAYSGAGRVSPPQVDWEAELAKHAGGDPKALEELAIVLRAWRSNPKNFWNFRLSYEGGGYCAAFLENLCARLPADFRDGESALKVTPMYLTQGDPGVFGGLGMLIGGTPAHFALRVEFPDGFVVYFDNGWAGTDGIFSFMVGTKVPTPERFMRDPIPTNPAGGEPGFRR